MEEPVLQEEPLLTVVEPDRPAEPFSCTVELAVSARTDFQVRLPEEADWLTCDVSSGTASTEKIVFSLETNMEDFMREALVRFLRPMAGRCLPRSA